MPFEVKTYVDESSYGTPVTQEDLNKIEKQINTLTKCMDKTGKVLWEGNFTGGSIQVPDIEKYKLVIILAENLISMIAVVQEDTVSGIMGTVNTWHPQVRLTSCLFSRLGNTLTYSNGCDVVDVRGNNKDVNGISSGIAVTKIIGLI